MSKNSNAKAIIKELAMQAKQRLKNGKYDQSDYYSNKNNYELKNQLRMITTKNCSKPEITIKIINDSIEEENFTRRVYALLQSDEDIVNHISKLTDKEAYESFSKIEQEKYILDLSEKYTKIRDNYFNKYCSC